MGLTVVVTVTTWVGRNEECDGRWLCTAFYCPGMLDGLHNCSTKIFYNFLRSCSTCSAFRSLFVYPSITAAPWQNARGRLQVFKSWSPKLNGAFLAPDFLPKDRGNGYSINYNENLMLLGVKVSSECPPCVGWITGVSGCTWWLITSSMNWQREYLLDFRSQSWI